ncbi:MAG: permease [Chloroflexota bacterium]|nr:permease [Chloroflexota bacterium]
MNIAASLLDLLHSGLGGLAAYLAAHVLLCLLPAFFIAGALAALMPKEAITRYLGRSAPKWISYPASALGGFFLAVCSCTIMPLFASIYKKGAGLGPAITFLFVGPAVNILAISFTGVQIGLDIAIARIILSMIFGILIGLLMAWFFRKDDAAHDEAAANNHLFDGKASIPLPVLIFFLLLLGTLLAGTLQIGLFRTVFYEITLPGTWAVHLQTWLDTLIPKNPALGIEGVCIHGLFIIALLIAIALTAIKGFRDIFKGFNSWTYVTLGLITLMLIIASFSVAVNEVDFVIGLNGRVVAEIILLTSIWWMAASWLSAQARQEWLWETWRFVKQIIPLLLVGVFVASIARALIPSIWIKTFAGRNTFWANLAGVLFGVFMYFPTLVEVPVAQTFLSLGMHRGPLLAYLLADPELSLQSILITNTVIGKKKTALYVLLVSVFSTLSGLIFGWFIR